ncbi:DUF421 domain-containing protein [Ectobacillus polymachus]|uniref:DUF421 domain-containing protein n=1 Tax=Ectobacillus polymachus TaxID=1508806 RepID=UPI003A8A8256
MHLFTQAEHLYVYEWIARAIIAYLFLLFVAKMMGQRSVAQLRFLDVILILLLEGNLSNPLTDERVDLTGAMVTTLVLILLHTASSIISLHVEWWRKFLEPSPLLLVHNGDVQWKNLKRARISIDFLLSELRLHNIEAIEKVAIALWEPGGKISSFLKTEYTPITKEDGHIPSTPLSMFQIVMKDGKTRKDALLSLGKSEEWLVDQIGKEKIPIILLAMANSQGDLRFIYKK